MKIEFKPMSWLVKYFNCNAEVIEDYDVLKYREDFIKKLKKKCATKDEFAEKMRREMMHCFWSKSEWELIIEIDDNYVWLSPWIGSRYAEQIKIDVTNDTSFDWRGFAEEHIDKQIYRTRAKIDVFDQLEYQWSQFVSYCWGYKHKWQRKKVTSNGNKL